MDERLKSEKEELLDKKIEEVRKRNEARLKKFQEAEEDRKKAEEAGCAVNRKKSTFEDCYSPKNRGSHNKSGNVKPKKYMPGTSEEWKEYTQAKNKSNVEHEDMSRHINDSNLNENNNNNSFNCKKERTPKGNVRAIYVPKHLQNRDSPENVKPPPPDPRNSFLADSYRSPNTRIKTDDQTGEQQAQEQRMHQADSPVNNTGPQGTYQGDARQRINQLKALRNQDQSLSHSDPPKMSHHNMSDVPKSHINQRNRTNYSKHAKQAYGVDSIGDNKMRESLVKPIKSILKKPKHVDDFDNSQPIIAVITTPGDDDDDVCGDEGAQGYNKKTEEAICDWLKNSEFENGDDDDEWEDVEDDEDVLCNNQHESAKEAERSNGNPTTDEPVVITITTKPSTVTMVSVDEELEAFEKDDTAFQNFIMQHTLTLDRDRVGFDWASEVERVSLENKHKIDLEEVKKLASENE